MNKLFLPYPRVSAEARRRSLSQGLTEDQVSPLCIFFHRIPRLSPALAVGAAEDLTISSSDGSRGE